MISKQNNYQENDSLTFGIIVISYGIDWTGFNEIVPIAQFSSSLFSAVFFFFYHTHPEEDEMISPNIPKCNPKQRVILSITENYNTTANLLFWFFPFTNIDEPFFSFPKLARYTRQKDLYTHVILHSASINSRTHRMTYACINLPFAPWISLRSITNVYARVALGRSAHSKHIAQTHLTFRVRYTDEENLYNILRILIKFFANCKMWKVVLNVSEKCKGERGLYQFCMSL